MDSLQISGKDLGAMSLPGFCPRCLWLKLRCKLPFQMPFPGIFSSIDSYTKKVVQEYFRTNNKLPAWLSPLGEVTKSLPTPSWSRFKTTTEYLITLTGVPDALFELRNNTLCIPDFKTARYTNTQDELFAMYLVQLNVYAMIAEALGMLSVSRLALVYMEPQTTLEVAAQKGVVRGRGFLMPFAAKILEVESNPEVIVTPLLQEARRIYDLSVPPEGAPSCQDCQRLAEVYKLLGS